MFLNDVSEEMEQLRSEHEKQSEEIRRVNMLLSEHNQREEILKNTLVAAQRTSEELKENARKQSQLLLKEAELAADRLVEAAQARAHEIEKDIVELKMQKRQVLNSILAAIANLRNLIPADERKRGPARQAEFPEAQNRTLMDQEAGSPKADSNPDRGP